ncbi:acetate/propionate family kinase [Polaromonas naphthalenivorans]|uniref:Acetate kinase n=1 Tax=Polaromonas naphthalenivorans (strain CJ2) TaxID=365044 RepID=A1VVX1_POLNA|nr:acetate/propionate family kinase [Polaromonas naphthalenivorans]ABM39799.1 acetate kinase [Polaromonas naphthalenivorans CJ2]
MRILVINAGSSSVKFSVFDMDTQTTRFKHEIEIGTIGFKATLAQIPVALVEAGETRIDAIGHRVAHGGEHFRDATLVDDDVIAAIEVLAPLAPLHNPPALYGIETGRIYWPNAPQIAVFDTAFHASIPACAHTYAVPQAWRKAGLRRYGFHGTSHKYVMERVAQELKASTRDLRIISCHLGNGASVCAIDRGVSVDTSMGVTALEGLVMGSRSGDVDPGIFGYLQRSLALSIDEIENALYHESGLTALSGLGNDMRRIETAAAEADPQAQLALNVFAYRARKYIGAYAAAMGGCDVLAFTGGIGENSASMRRRICDRLEFLGLYLDEDRNSSVKLDGFAAPQIQQPHSRIRVIVTQTREQWMIAKEVHRFLSVQADKRPDQLPPAIPVAVSAHHVHLTQASVEALFGAGCQLTKQRDLSQAGAWTAVETVNVIGPRGIIRSVRVLGPCRRSNQIEVSATETFTLGIEAPVRISGDTADTPTLTLEGPAGRLQTNGLIVAQRHIHMQPEDAKRFGLADRDLVDVAIDSPPRTTVFRDVAVRIDPQFKLEMHIDTDEANAAAISHGGDGDLMLTLCHARLTACKPVRNIFITTES